MVERPDRSFQSFGVVPAAGRSRRMGQPKLLMPWGETTVIERVIAAWRRSGVDHVVATVHTDDAAVKRLCERNGAIVVAPPTAPPEMKDSVLAALTEIGSRFHPAADAVWLLAPADMPRLSCRVIDALLDQHRPSQPAILVPTYTSSSSCETGQGQVARRGHPVLFPWPLAKDVAGLNENEGVNALLARGPVREIVLDEPSVLDDLDTIEDFRRLSAE